ncbi:hypothetical protein PybrP1_003401 [[Pythium] brassicae (nom. inval.)]|nr:hypothetical protein PybrP1_003401 [[Pythium] brassicae (nom. inval.)]
MQAEGADFSGWGSKQGSKMKTWKKRFFVLRGRELVYYSSSEEKGRITVAGADFAPELKNGLLVRGEKQRKSQVLKMKTATADESKAWLEKLRQAVASTAPADDHRSMSFRTRSASGSTISSSNHSTISSSNHSSFAAPSLPSLPERHHHSDASVPPAVLPPFRQRANTASNEKRGWLLKEGSKVKSWKKRYFVLRGNVLTYYADEQSSPKLGSVVVQAVETSFTTPFTLDVSADGGRVLRIAADSLEDIEGWDLAISEAIARGSSGESLGADVARRASDNQSSESAARFALTASSISTASSSSYNDDVGEQHGKMQYHPAHQQSAWLDEQHQQERQLAANESNNIACEGWLLKQGQRTKTWKRRYFTLTNSSIEYRHDPDDIPNEEEVVVDIVFETKPDGIVAHVDLDSGRTITIAGESRNEFKRWAKALSELTDSKAYKRLVKQGSSLMAFGMEDRGACHAVKAQEVAVPVAAEVPGPPAQPEIKYGWLLKQGNLIRSWKRRYFVLEGDSLQYFEHIDKPARGGGAVARVVRDPATAGDNCLDVHLANGRILKVASEDAHELRSWYDALLNASRLIPTTLLSEAQSPTLSNNVNDGVTISDPDGSAKRLTKKLKQEGWLLKKGQNFKTWKMRFFVLERTRLLYYASDDDAGRGEVLGSGVVFEASVGDSRPFCIDVRFQNGRLLQVVAPDEEQFSMWLDALQNASNLTESFLSQHEDSQREGEAAAFDDEFDLDFADDGTADEDLDWSSNQHGESERDTKSGFSTWSAAMTNKPEFERSSSWSSSEDASGDETRSAALQNGSASPPHSLANAQTAVVAGWLNKEGDAIKTWKRRYFSLHGSTLRYFKSESGPLLRAFTVARVVESLSLPLGLEVETTTDRTLVLTAESKSEYAKWFAALETATSATVGSTSASPLTAETIVAVVRSPVHGNAKASTPSSVSVSSPAPASPSAAAGVGLVSTVNAEGKTVVAYNGWLEKEGERIKTWKRRYFTYKKGALLYYRDIGGVALGHGIVTSVGVDASKAFTLSVQLENERSMRVSAESETRASVAGAKLEKLQNGAAAADIGGRGDVRERLDPNDYLANDTISNESFLRIQGEPQRQHGESNPGSFAVASRRSFKGDLSFGDEDEEEKEEEKQTQKQALVAAESAEDLAYYRTLLAESELERERREAEKAGNVSGCAPCCVVM